MIKTLNEAEGNMLNLIKDIFLKVIASIILNGERLEVFLLRSARMSALTTSTQYLVGDSS